jgi:hypothetical protein
LKGLFLINTHKKLEEIVLVGVNNINNLDSEREENGQLLVMDYIQDSRFNAKKEVQREKNIKGFLKVSFIT